jgi:hypothetical protein
MRGTDMTAMHHTLHKVLTTLAASGAHRRFGFARTAPTSVERCAAVQQARTPRPLNADCSALRSSQRTRVSSASIFSQRASTAMARMTNELISAICGKDA